MSREEQAHLSRLHTNDLELGYTEAIQKHVSRHVVPPKAVSQRKLDYEHWRPRFLRECIAEATGVFFYVFPGIAAIATFTINSTDSLGVAAFGSILQIGWAFSLGIAFAIITCAPTSGGHFNPAVTICLAIWQGFPWKKVPHYIFSQIFGSFAAGLLMVGMYWPELSAFKAETLAKGGSLTGFGSPASTLCTFPLRTQTNQGYLFMTEFFVDSFIGIVIWSCLDPANPFVTPASVPFTIGLAYGTMIWGFAGISVSTNLARDLGTRIVAAIFFGSGAFTDDNGYCWIAILVNVPATLFATSFYEAVLRDSLKMIGNGRAMHKEGEEGLKRHLSKVGAINKAGMENSPSRDLKKEETNDSSYNGSTS
ncbi:MAG: hypothetical protein M1834_001557 [Cirrosporium novae-zelandiae]|nr:MAG: hypothetical protein M1834_004074 [Cirrosporium novae-zelandiae]KAI9735542.1 MAG: hypothetical protein M1834_001557 [Cirrosporium novae-zelandiae]